MHSGHQNIKPIALRSVVAILLGCGMLIGPVSAMAQEGSGRRTGGKSAKAADKDGWISLFDGKTLKGWVATGNQKAWTVEDGMLVGRGDTGHLITKTEYTDCEFKADVMTEKGTNSGMYFRAQLDDAKWPKGYESQVNNTHGDWRKTGSLYGRSDVREQLAKDNEWWTQHIICRGNHYIIKVNGKVAVDYIDKEHRFKRGHLALQQHDPGSVVRYKNLFVKPLEAAR